MPPFRLSVTSTWPELQPAPAAGFDFCFFDLDTGVEGHLQESIEAYSVTDYYHHGQKPESNEKMPAYHIASSTKTIADYICNNIDVAKYMDITISDDETAATKSVSVFSKANRRHARRSGAHKRTALK